MANVSQCIACCNRVGVEGCTNLAPDHLIEKVVN